MFSSFFHFRLYSTSQISDIAVPRFVVQLKVFRELEDNLIIMKTIKFLGLCLLSTLLVACGKSGSKSAASTNEVKTEDVTPKEESAVSLSETPLELADFAVECFRINEREKLLQYATDRCQKRLIEDIAIEEQMKNDRGLKKMRERLKSTTYTRSSVSDMGSSNKLVRYTSSPSKYNMKVLLEQKNGQWFIDQVGPDR